MNIDTTINKYSLTNQDVITALRRCANDRSVCDECVFCSDNVKKWRWLMGIAADRLEKLTAERDEYKRRAAAAEADILDMLIEEGGNLDLCHWCAGNCPDNDYSQCEQKIRWRGPCAKNGGSNGEESLIRKISNGIRRANKWLQTALCWYLETMRSDLERIERERNLGCEYCQPDDCCSPLSWQYGLDHIFPDYRFCPICGREICAAAKNKTHNRK